MMTSGAALQGDHGGADTLVSRGSVLNVSLLDELFSTPSIAARTPSGSITGARFGRCANDQAHLRHWRRCVESG